MTDSPDSRPSRQQRRWEERTLRERAIVRPARPDDFHGYPIPGGSWVVVTRYPRAGISHKRLVAQTGDDE